MTLKILSKFKKSDYENYFFYKSESYKTKNIKRFLRFLNNLIFNESNKLSLQFIQR